MNEHSKRLLFITFLFYFAFIQGCASYPKPSIEAKLASSHFLWVAPELEANESLVYGRTVIIEDPKKGSRRRPSIVITKDGTKEHSKWLVSFTNFYWRVPQGTYRISSIYPDMQKGCIEPTPLIFEVPEAGKAYYLGTIEIDLSAEYTYLFFTGGYRAEPKIINIIGVVDEYVETKAYLENRNPQWQSKSEKQLIQMDHSIGPKLVLCKDSAYQYHRPWSVMYSY